MLLWTGPLSDAEIRKKSLSYPLKSDEHHALYGSLPNGGSSLHTHDPPYFVPMTRYTAAKSRRPIEHLYTLATLDNPWNPAAGLVKQRSLYHSALEAYHAKHLPEKVEITQEAKEEPPATPRRPLSSREYAATTGKWRLEYRQREGRHAYGLSPNIEALLGGVPEIDPNKVLPRLSRHGYTERPRFRKVVQQAMEDATPEVRTKIEEAVDTINAPMTPEHRTPFTPGYIPYTDLSTPSSGDSPLQYPDSGDSPLQYPDSGDSPLRSA